MDALELLTKQHREVEKLFKLLEQADDNSREDVFLDLADKIATHCALEERLFYPAVYNEDTEDELQEAVEEHLQFKRLLADMLDMDVKDPQFAAKCTVLREDVKHHVSEEEEQLFKRVMGEFKREVLVRLGEEMEALNMMLEEADELEEVSNETEAAPRLQRSKE